MRLLDIDIHSSPRPDNASAARNPYSSAFCGTAILPNPVSIEQRENEHEPVSRVPIRTPLPKPEHSAQSKGYLPLGKSLSKPRKTWVFSSMIDSQKTMAHELLFGDA
jgi:hypothetical protein